MTSVITADGTHREVDAIFCATGFNTSFTGRFPVHGRNGMSLDERWGKYPDTYLGLCTDGFPNMFFVLGPNTGPSTGSLLLIIEKQVDYIVEVLKKTQRDAVLVVEPKKTSVKNFSDYCQSYFPKTIFMEDCRSWYKSEKAGGKVTALWPGLCSFLDLSGSKVCPQLTPHQRINVALGEGTSMPEMGGFRLWLSKQKSTRLAWGWLDYR